MDRVIVKPAREGLKVRKPVGGHLAAEGEEQNLDSYWLRRQADGDVEMSPAPAAPAEAAAEQPKAAKPKAA